MQITACRHLDKVDGANFRSAGSSRPYSGRMSTFPCSKSRQGTSERRRRGRTNDVHGLPQQQVVHVEALDGAALLQVVC